MLTDTWKPTLPSETPGKLIPEHGPIHPIDVVTQAAVAQAVRYAAQIRWLEDFVSNRQARNVRRAWRKFYWSIEGIDNALARKLHDAYWIEYCK